MIKTTEILVVGSHIPGLFMRVKRPPIAGQTVIGWDYQEPVDGGKGSNQAIAAAKLGGRVSFVGCLGSDRIGDEGVRWMKEAGVDVSHVRRSRTSSSGVGFILLDEFGVPAMVACMGANAELSREDIDRALEDASASRVLLTQFEIPPEIALYAARCARDRGIRTIVNPAPAPETPVEVLDIASILTPNETEALALLGLPVEQVFEPGWLAAEVRRKTGAGCVLVTLGDRGVAGVDEDGEWLVPAPAVTVLDSSGAGDVFCAGLAVELARGENVRAASRWACAAASLSVTRPGTIPGYSTREEVEAFLNGTIHEL